MNGFTYIWFLYLKYRKTGIIVCGDPLFLAIDAMDTPKIWNKQLYTVQGNLLLKCEMTSFEPTMFHYHGHCFPTIKIIPKAVIETVNSNEHYATWICHQSSLAQRLKVLLVFVHCSSDTGPTRLIRRTLWGINY